MTTNTQTRVSKNYPALINLLNAFSNGKNWTTSALSERTNTPVRTIQTQVAQLRDYGYVQRNENNSYRITEFGQEITNTISEMFTVI